MLSLSVSSLTIVHSGLQADLGRRSFTCSSQAGDDGGFTQEAAATTAGSTVIQSGPRVAITPQTTGHPTDGRTRRGGTAGRSKQSALHRQDRVFQKSLLTLSAVQWRSQLSSFRLRNGQHRVVTHQIAGITALRRRTAFSPIRSISRSSQAGDDADHTGKSPLAFFSSLGVAITPRTTGPPAEVVFSDPARATDAGSSVGL